VCHDDYIASGQRDFQIPLETNNSRALNQKMINQQLRRARCEWANSAVAGVRNPQGAENSALKYNAPFSTTPRRISDRASMSRLD
jgi:hypothetical protein